MSQRDSNPATPLVLPSMDALFSRVQSYNAFEETLNRIVGAIKARLLSPGDRLPPERELAQQLNVSRSTLREALAVLIEAGYLEARRGRTGGTFVVGAPRLPEAPKRETILNRMREQLPALLDFRRVVEPAAAELAARRANAADLAHLKTILDSMLGAERDFYRYRAMDARFHVGIARSANSPLLLQAVTDVQTALTDILDLIVYHSERVLQHSTEYHWNILEAIRVQRPDEARQHMLDHIRATESIIYGLVPEAAWPDNYFA